MKGEAGIAVAAFDLQLLHRSAHLLVSKTWLVAAGRREIRIVLLYPCRDDVVSPSPWFSIPSS